MEKAFANTTAENTEFSLILVTFLEPNPLQNCEKTRSEFDSEKQHQKNQKSGRGYSRGIERRSTNGRRGDKEGEPSGTAPSPRVWI